MIETKNKNRSMFEIAYDTEPWILVNWRNGIRIFRLQIKTDPVTYRDQDSGPLRDVEDRSVSQKRFEVPWF